MFPSTEKLLSIAAELAGRLNRVSVSLRSPTGKLLLLHSFHHSVGLKVLIIRSSSIVGE